MSLAAHGLHEKEDEEQVLLEDIQIEQIEVINSVELESEHVWEDRLIEEVKNYRLLWDRTRRDYGHQEKCSIIWAIIAKTLDRTPAYCSGQWKNLRDSYVRRLKCVRRLAFHGLTPRKPSWRHFDAMSFLDEHVNHRGNQVDGENDQPLPNCSSKNVAFFDDGSVRASNKNKLGGMGKKGPSHVRISSLPKEPVALFSRIGLGEITVVDDTAEPDDSCGHFIGEDGDGGHVEDFHVRLESPEGVMADTEYVKCEDDVLNPNVVHIIIEENDDVNIDDDRIVESSEAIRAVSRNDARQESANENADNPEERQDRVSSTDESKRNLRPGRKRSYRQLAEGNHRNVEPDDVIIDNAKTKVVAKEPESLETTERWKSDDFKEEIRCGLATIDTALNSLLEAQNDENSLFARSIAQNLARLPERVRAETKLKIQRILYEAELSSRHGAKRSKPPDDKIFIATGSGSTNSTVVTDGSDLRTTTVGRHSDGDRDDDDDDHETNI